MSRNCLAVLLMISLVSNVYAALNPAPVYCRALGYQYSINNTQEGQQGICNLPDGSAVDAWAFLREEVGEDYSYCEKQGYRFKTVADTKKCSPIFSHRCSVCVKENGEEIEVTTLMGLSFSENVCGDGKCLAPWEDEENCPEDCASSTEERCSKIKDNFCDSDCEEDPDCVTKKAGEEFQVDETKRESEEGEAALEESTTAKTKRETKAGIAKKDGVKLSLNFWMIMIPLGMLVLLLIILIILRKRAKYQP